MNHHFMTISFSNSSSYDEYSDSYSSYSDEPNESPFVPSNAQISAMVKPQPPINQCIRRPIQRMKQSQVQFPVESESSSGRSEEESSNDIPQLQSPATNLQQDHDIKEDKQQNTVLPTPNQPDDVSHNSQSAKDTEAAQNDESHSHSSCDNDENSPRTKRRRSSNFSLHNPLAHFQCRRETSIGWGKRYIFRLFGKENTLLMTAKAKGFSIDTLVIETGSEAHLSSKTPNSIIMCNNPRTCFRLFMNGDINQTKTTNFSDQTYSSEMFFEATNDMIPRTSLLTIPPLDMKLNNLSPTFNKNKNTWQLKFDGRFVIRSKRNQIMIKEDGSVAMIIKKITKNSLEIEIFIDLNPIYIFFVAISEWLCKC